MLLLVFSNFGKGHLRHLCEFRNYELVIFEVFPRQSLVLVRNAWALFRWVSCVIIHPSSPEIDRVWRGSILARILRKGGDFLRSEPATLSFRFHKGITTSSPPKKFL